MFSQAFVEGFKNIVQEKRISITAIIIIYVSIMSVCLIGSVWIFFSYGIRVLDREIQIVALLKRRLVQSKKPN